MNLITGLTLFTSLSFLFFGAACLYDRRMKDEFVRYGLENERRLTGFLQLIGGVGLLGGLLLSPLLAMLAALGLSVLMILGFGVRIKIRDTLLQTLPSLSYAILNAYLAFGYYAMV